MVNSQISKNSACPSVKIYPPAQPGAVLTYFALVNKPEFTVNLLKWNAGENQRQMPWKGEKDPYRIWLSEIMLQQTRVEQGWNYYNRFIETFPTVQHLARAEDNSVFKLWEGLGYYSRCRNLLATARHICETFDGKFPNTYEALLKLKGIGPYTAAAIASFAFSEPKAVVDGNVQRVLARYFGISVPINSASGKKIYQELAQSLIDPDRPDIYNQAIMDFGALICKPQAPLCLSCPQQRECQAFNLKQVKNLPVKESKAPKKQRWFHYFLLETESSIFIRQRLQKDIWQHLYEFMLIETSAGSIDPYLMLKDVLGDVQYSIIQNDKVFKQVLSHQIIQARFIRVSLPENAEPKGLMRIPRADLEKFPFPKIITGYLKEVPSF